MQPPEDTEIFENAVSYMWYDREGNLCATFKKNYEPTTSREEAEAIFRNLHEILQGRKANFILDIDNAKSSRKEARDTAAEEMPKYINAIAFVGTKPMARMLVNIFSRLKTPPFPTKVFATEDKARKWLRNFQ